jgi:acyl-coenzyme A synthetase/AMP-(fatty) acid ligase
MPGAIAIDSPAPVHTGHSRRQMPDPFLTTGAQPILRCSRQTPQAIAVIENGVAYSYATLARNIVLASRVLATAGLAPGMIAGIECESRYLNLVLNLAAEIVGAGHTCLVEYDLTADTELARRCDMLCVQSRHEDLLAHPRMVRLSPLFVRTMFNASVEDAELDVLGRVWPADDIVRIGRSSGTTGKPKYIFFSRSCMRENVDVIPFLVGYDTTRMNFISLYRFIHIGTYTDSIAAFQHGATVVYGLGEQLAAHVRRFTGCHSYLFVRDAAFIVESRQFRDGRADHCSLCVAGGFVPPALRRALREAVTNDIVVAYSTNETRFITTARDDEHGFVLPDASVRIVDDAGHDVAPGEPGMILARTPRMSAGYLWDEARTGRNFVDGWFVSGDIGTLSESGKLVVLGRADEMINLGGIKLAPGPIEEKLRAVDGVTDAVLIDVLTELGTGMLHTFIERGDSSIDRTIEALIQPLLVGYVNSYQLHYVAGLPRTQNGKVRRDQLKQSIAHARAMT